MPTENRSSNTEMVSVPSGVRSVLSMILNALDRDAADGKTVRGEMAQDLRSVMAQLAPQPHPEPIAWMVGTAIWWTKEEAERDAAEVGQPVVGLGPMTAHQGEPAWFMTPGGVSAMHVKAKAMSDQQGLDTSAYSVPLYTHADPGEVERLARKCQNADLALKAQTQNCNTLRAQLAEQESLLREVLEAFKLEADGSCINPGRDFIRPWAAKLAALSASAQPSAPVECAICRDLGNQCMECEEGEFREWADRHFAAADYRKTDAGVFTQDWMRHAYGAWCARGALVRQS